MNRIRYQATSSYLLSMLLFFRANAYSSRQIKEEQLKLVALRRAYQSTKR